MLDILIYCPDSHILFDGRTPDHIGVGGGITARVRMGRALARRGYRVTHVGHCLRKESIDGVSYVPLDSFTGAKVDIAVVTTSGGEYDLGPYRLLDVNTKFTAVWIHGVDQPDGLFEVDYDVVYAVSKFIKGIAVENWGLPTDKVLVSYNGYDPAHFDNKRAIEKDTFRLIYSSHPSKGLEPAIRLLEILRHKDERFHLEVFGGCELWGGPVAEPVTPIGVNYSGLIGQSELAEQLSRSSFSIQLQSRPEPGALAIPEAQRAGAIILASPVGVYPELITDNWNGIMIEGNPLASETLVQAAERILEVANQPRKLKRLQRASVSSSLPVSHTVMAWENSWSGITSRR